MSDYFYDAIVREVIDGDTVRLDVDLGFRHWQHGMTIRLFGVNAPEKNTPLGKLAKQWLQGYLPVGSKVQLESSKDKENKGCWLGKICRFPGDTRTANEELLWAGHGPPWDGHGKKPMPTVEVEIESLRCPKCGGRDVVDASQSLDCRSCDHSW